MARPTGLAIALGLGTTGRAFALKRVVTAAAGYVVILRGKTFSVGGRELWKMSRSRERDGGNLAKNIESALFAASFDKAARIWLK